MVNPEVEVTVAHVPYREALRPIGAFLDSIQAYDLVLAEIDGGFLWSYFQTGEFQPARSATISFEDLPKLREHFQRAKRAAHAAPDTGPLIDAETSQILPMFPNGYEEKLRSLGAKLDSQYARQIQVVENGTDLLVRFVLSPPAYMRRVQPSLPDMLQFREDVYSAAETRELIAASRARRGSKYFY